MALTTDHILVVEDDEALRDFVATALRDAGASVVPVSDGLGAVEAFRRDARFTAVVLDLVLPGMNGLEVLDVLRATPAFRSLPVLVTTGTLIWPGQFEGQHPVTTLSKPFTADQLITALQRLILTRAA